VVVSVVVVDNFLFVALVADVSICFRGKAAFFYFAVFVFTLLVAVLLVKASLAEPALFKLLVRVKVCSFQVAFLSFALLLVALWKSIFFQLDHRLVYAHLFNILLRGV